MKETEKGEKNTTSIEYEFDVEKIVHYLSKYCNDLHKLYKWDVNVDKLVGLKVLTEKEVDDLNKNEPFKSNPYEKELVLKQKINKRLLETIENDKNSFYDLCLWIIKDWGRITSAKDEQTIELIENFLNQKESIYKRIASSSKVGSYLYPEKFVIYDSRVAYSLNWIILSENAGKYFFPIPEGRNSKMKAFDMNVLIRLKNIDYYKPNRIEELERRSFISNADKNCYIPRKKAYTELNKLIKKINQKLWSEEKSDMLYFTEMLLFSIADREIYTDITHRLSIGISK